jgi:DNA-directed RNA polymerase subunit RPC12/RpoP
MKVLILLLSILLTQTNYLCKKCSTHIKSVYSPSTTGCPKGGSHSWYNLGPVGKNDYQCKKCSTEIKSDESPNTTGCPSGGSHSWNKLN